VGRGKATGETNQTVTLKEIAQRCGVGKTTVFRALSQAPRVKPATRARILAMAAELGYDPAEHEVARHLAYHKSGRRVRYQTIGLLLHKEAYSTNYYVRLHQGIVAEVSDRQYTLLSMMFSSGHSANMTILQQMFRRGMDGVIVMPGSPVIERALADLQERRVGHHLPIVSNITEGDRHVVTADEAQGAYQVARQLLALGHRHFLHFYSDSTNLARRLDGIRRALAEAGFTPAEHLHLYDVPAQGIIWTEPVGLQVEHEASTQYRQESQAFARYLAQHPEITAILGINDTCAIHAWRALVQAGARVPEEYSIVGFDDTDPLLDTSGTNQLSSVRIPLEEIGRRTVQILIQQIEHPDAPVGKEVLPTEVFLRSSVAPRKSE